MIKKKEIKWILTLLILFMLTSCTKTNVLHEEDKKGSIQSGKKEINTIPSGENKKIANENKNKDEGDSSKDEANIIDLSNYTTTINIDNEYEKLEDIRPESIPEIKLGFFIDRDRVVNANYPHYLVKEVSDGYICVSIEKEGNKSLSYMKKILRQSTIPKLNLPGGLGIRDEEIVVTDKKNVKLLPTIRKLNLSGEVVWEKQLKDVMLVGTVNHLTVLDDEKFLFLVSGHSPTDNNSLIKCDKDGNMLWKKELNPFCIPFLFFDRVTQVVVTDKDEIILIGLAYPQIIVTDTGDITMLGHCYPLESSYYSKEWDILAAKLDMDGNMLDQKYLGGREYEYIDEVKYNKNIGIVFIGRTSSSDGDFALTKKNESPNYFVACMDENFQIQWVWNEEKAGVIYDHLLLSDDEMVIMGSSLISNFIYDNFFINLDNKGDLLGKHSELSSSIWANGTQLLPNGHLVVGKQLTVLVDDDTKNQHELIIFDKDNEKIAHLKDIKLKPDEIISTDDGGFIIKSIRPVRTIPQPLHVSSIWFEHEVILMKFNRDYDIEWRKTYNKYKDIRIDFVQPLKNGSVLVE